MSLTYKTVVMELREVLDMVEGIKKLTSAEPGSRIDQLCSNLGRLISDIEFSLGNQTVDDLRSSGHTVIVWTPDELGIADSGQLEDVVIERGNNFIEHANSSEPDSA